MQSRMPEPSRTLFGVALLATSCGAAMADDGRLDTVATANGFYVALGSGADAEADRSAAANSVSALLDEDVEIDLQDLDIIQTKNEFVESLDGLFDALEDGRIVYRVEDADGDAHAASVLVCYDFASNQMLTRETLTVQAGLITAMAQQQIAETCDAL